MTVLGHHTVAELRDWLAAIDSQMAQTAAAYAAFAPTWEAQDPAAHHEWDGEWKALQTRYGTARTRAQIAFAKALVEVGVPDSLNPVEDEWQGVLHALAKTPGAVQKGDFQDLVNRLTAAEGKPVDMSKMPQPKAADADLGVLQAANTTIRTGEKAVDAIVRAGKEIAPSKGTATLVVVGLGLVLGVLLATKSVLR